MTTDSALTRVERLDRLPFTRKHRKLLVGSGVGWALDAMDVGLISFVMTALIAQWGLTPTEASWLGSIGFAGMAIGASVGGLLADRIGRKNVFALTLFIYGLATGASALAGSLAVLMTLRFVVGIGLGAELPVASTLVSEFAPRRIRGRVVVILEGFWAVGWFAAALIGYFVIAPTDSGWRWGLVIGAIPAAYALVVRWTLPESVRFLESRGKHGQAEQVVREFEQAAGVSSPIDTAQSKAPATDQDDQALVIAAKHTAGQRLAELFSPTHRNRTIGLWLVWFLVNFAYYGAFLWLPTILYNQGIEITKSFGYTVIITAAQLPGYAVAAWLIEAWGRRPTLIAFLAGSGVSAYFFALAAVNANITLVVTAGCVLSFFALGAWGAIYAVSPEMYPTSIRGTGTGWAAGFGRIASIIGPLMVPVISNKGGTHLVFVIICGVYLLAAASALLLVERRGVALEE